MRHYQKTGALLALYLLGCGTGVYAQGRGYYNRVTTSTRQVIETSPRASVQRGGGLGVASSNARYDPLRPYTDARSAARYDPLRPYTDQARQNARTGVPRGSSWEQEEPVTTETRPVTVQTRSHNYYPTMRSGVGLQPPVMLTASRFAGHLCTCGRSAIMASAGHHR